MQSEARFRTRFERPVANHAFGAADALLGRLKDERHHSGQLRPAGGQQLGHGQQDRHVPVVAASVVGVRVRRSVRLAAVGLGQRQGIHVGAQHDGAAGSTPAQHGDHAGLAHARSHVVHTQRPQALGNDTRRAVLLMRDLRVPVKIAAELDGPLALLSRQHGASAP